MLSVNSIKFLRTSFVIFLGTLLLACATTYGTNASPAFKTNAVESAKKYLAESMEERVTNPFCNFRIQLWSDATIVRATNSVLRSGIKLGDRIIEINGIAIDDRKKAYSVMENYMPGEELNVVVNRGNNNIPTELVCGDASIQKELA